MILVRPFCSYTQVVTDLVEEIDGFMTQRSLHFPAAPKFQKPEGILVTTEAREMTRRPLLRRSIQGITPATLIPDGSAVWVSGDGVGPNCTVTTGELCCWLCRWQPGFLISKLTDQDIYNRQ